MNCNRRCGSPYARMRSGYSIAKPAEAHVKPFHKPHSLNLAQLHSKTISSGLR